MIDQSATTETNDALARVLDECMAILKAGRPLDRDALLAAHPELTDDLDSCLASLEFICRADESHPPQGKSASYEALVADDSEQETRLGEFVIKQEIGRGGMGVVYEAEQSTLNRRVALKVLPFAAAMDEKQLRRFKNEALAAAHLHHGNIVPVYAVGSERGVHYYAMQLVEGRTLAELIRDLRNGVDDVVRFVSTNEKKDVLIEHTTEAGETEAVAALSTLHSRNGQEFFRQAARLGVQAAEALEHAHEMGIIHRDIKPANLMVDDRGHLWITDLGLARLQSDSNLTATGDLLGTLRYMSPEQAVGRPGQVDHRTDIYSLGASLYELLTLQPVFDAAEKPDLLRQVTEDEPIAPGKINRSIPTEFETVVLKSINKDPAERYASAADLARDLRNYLEDRPILAKRPTVLQRLRRWGRRHKPIVITALLGALVSTLILSAALGWITRDRAARDTIIENQVNLALEEVAKHRAGGDWAAALDSAHNAARLAAGGVLGELHRNQIDKMIADAEMALRLENIRFNTPGTEDHSLAFVLESEPKFAAAFAAYGIDVLHLPEHEAIDSIQQSQIRVELATALDMWAVATTLARQDTWKKLLRLSQAADPDPWRIQLRAVLFDRISQGIQSVDAGALAELARTAEETEQPALSSYILANLMRRLGLADDAIEVLLAAQNRYPSDFWINFELGECLRWPASERQVKSLRYYYIALALRPESEVVKRKLGIAYRVAGQYTKAVEVLQEALDMDPNDGMAWYHLGTCLRALGARTEEAIKALQRSVELRPGVPSQWYELAVAWASRGKPEEARSAYERGLELQKLAPLEDEAAWNNEYRYHNTIAMAYRSAGQMEESEKFFLSAVEAAEYLVEHYPTPENLETHGVAYRILGNYGERTNRIKEALANFAIAVSIHESAVKAHPHHFGLRLELATSLNFEGIRGQSADTLLRAEAISASLVAEDPAHIVARLQLARSRYALALMYSRGDRHAEAIALIEKFISPVRPVWGRLEHHLHREGAAAHCNVGSWIFSACPDEDLRDSQKAVELAQQAVVFDPNRRDYHNTLGVAHYRAGNWKGCVATLEKSIEMSEGGDSFDFFFLAMAQQQLGNSDEAMKWLDKGIQWMEKNSPKNKELNRFRREAVETVGWRLETGARFHSRILLKPSA